MRLIVVLFGILVVPPLLGTILGLGWSGSGASAQQPCRVCNTAPGISTYSQSILSSGYHPPTGGYHFGGSYYDYGHHRRRNVARILDVAQINPAYTSAYSPDGYDSATQADILAQIRTLSARLDQLTALAASQKSGGTAVVPGTPAPVAPGKLGPPAPGSGSPTVIVTPQGGGTGGVTIVPPAKVAGPGGAAIGLAILNAKCAACHQAGKLLPEQKFTLLTAKGDLVNLTDKQKISVSNKTRTSQMPPPSNSQGIPPLSDAEYAAVADLLGF